MAETKSKTAPEAKAEPAEKEINMDKKVSVRNLAPWVVAFPNRTTGGDTVLQPKATARVRREEIVEQVYAGNRLLRGIDEFGSHATIIIEDEETRKYLEFDSADGKRKQKVLSDERVKELFDIKTQSTFEKQFKDAVRVRAEKAYVLDAIDRLGLNDYRKIEFCKQHCKFRLR